MNYKERTMLYGRRVAWDVAAIALMIAACTKSQSEKCTTDADCKDVTYPFCDVNGEFSASSALSRF